MWAGLGAGVGGRGGSDRALGAPGPREASQTSGSCDFFLEGLWVETGSHHGWGLVFQILALLSDEGLALGSWVTEDARARAQVPDCIMLSAGAGSSCPLARWAGLWAAGSQVGALEEVGGGEKRGSQHPLRAAGEAEGWTGLAERRVLHATSWCSPDVICSTSGQAATARVGALSPLFPPSRPVHFPRPGRGCDL